MRGEAIRARAKEFRGSIADIAAWHRRRRAEIALSVALVGGWLLVTYGVTAVVRPRIAWPMSIGLMLLTGSGWSVLWSIATKGLYVAHRNAARKALRGED